VHCQAGGAILRNADSLETTAVDNSCAVERTALTKSESAVCWRGIEIDMMKES